MARGGKRDGAGRKAGSATVLTRAIADGAAASGETPLEYMLRMMRDPLQEYAVRNDMAKAAAPYVHPKLTAIQHTGDKDNPIVAVTRIELIAADGNSTDQTTS